MNDHQWCVMTSMRVCTDNMSPFSHTILWYLVDDHGYTILSLADRIHGCHLSGMHRCPSEQLVDKPGRSMCCTPRLACTHAMLRMKYPQILMLYMSYML